MNLLLSHEAEEFVLLLINTIPISKFTQFIENIDQKKNWSDELCCCYYEDTGDYRFETFEGETYRMSYNGFADIVKLSIARSYYGSEDPEIRESIKATIKNTVFSSALDDFDRSIRLDIPLIG